MQTVKTSLKIFHTGKSKRAALLLASSMFAFCVFGEPPSRESKKPKLVVGIVVDQMRADYISRFWNKFEKKGFKRLVSDGFSCANTQYNYVPTHTAPGHASIFTGTVPAVHGIIANEWFNRETGKKLYCAEDDEVKSTGGCRKNVS